VLERPEFYYSLFLSIRYWCFVLALDSKISPNAITAYHQRTSLHRKRKYDHRIPFELSGDLSRVVTSINGLVDSTVAAIEDERKIEKSKDELITNVSHDIRTPLTSIIGYLGLIEDGQYHSEEDLLKYTHTAYIKAKQMKSLVDDLFEYTK
ncbi:hypothetical protein L8957_28705, partial [Klebsiella pneumoniae]|nr:hypothetical protein [Klebsiella pneumoniae]